MIKDSIKTVFKFPLMILGFAIPAIIMLAAYIPSFSFMAMDDLSALFTMMGFMLLFFLVVLFLQFVYTPVLHNYVFEASVQGGVDKGWFKRGLKRNWWKIFVTTLIASIPLYIIYMMFFFFTVATIFAASEGSYIPLIIVGILFIAFIFLWLAFLSISIVSVAAEEKFENGFSNIFKVGFKNIFRITLAYLVVLIPSIAAGGGYGYYMTYMMNNSHPTPVFWVITALAVIFTIAYNAISMPFIYVYTNKLHDKRKQELMPKENIAEEALQSDIL